MIPYGRQDISQADIDAVVEVLRSDWLTQGPMVPRFETAIAEFTGAPYAVAVNSATSALHIACLALDVGPGDVVWTSPNTFVASANCALYCGAQIDFVDIDSQSCNMSVQRLTEKLFQARIDNKLPKVVIPVHFAGQPCDMPAIFKLSREFGFKIIEDASHAIGASYTMKCGDESNTQSTTVKIGSCAHSDITVLSFHPVKIITSAEGGMALTKDAELAHRMSLLRSHGITRDPLRMRSNSIGPWYYEQLELGFNYRMTDVQAALGLSQLKRLTDFVHKRNEISRIYSRLLRDLPIRLPIVAEGMYSSWHLYPIRLNINEIKKSHRQVFEQLREVGIGVNLHYLPVHLQPYYRNLGFSEGQFPAAEAYSTESISLPIFPMLSEEQLLDIAAALRGVLH